MIFNQTFRNINRTREIIAVLIKYGFEDIIANSTLRNFVPERMRLSWIRQDKPALEYTRYERIRMVAEELGPTFIKLAQVLSNRPDMLPEALIKELEKLQDNVPPFPYEQVREIIHTEMGGELEEFFENFSQKPIASASIGQVHLASLKNGQKVVVKVQRPDVRETVDQDISIIKEIVSRTERYLQRQGIINAMDVVLAFERSMHKEMDYRNEARNIERCRQLYQNYKNFYIPKAFREYSTDKVLVIEFTDGCKISDVQQMRAWGLDPAKVAENGMSIYLTMIFEHGFFHADPHPGNVFVRQDGVIALIDFGMVGQLTTQDKFNFAGIFISFAKQDARQMAMYMRRLSLEDQITDDRQFEYDLNDLIDDFATLDVSESNIADMISRLQKIMYDYKMRFPGGVFLIFRAFAILEGIGKQLHPHFNTYEFIKPYGAKLLRERLKPKYLLSELDYRISAITSFLNTFPGEIREIVTKTNRGKLHFEIEHQGYGYLLKKLDSITNRIAITLIIVALIIGSSIIMLADLPPQLISPSGYPYMSLIGLFSAAGLFILLAYAILRRRKYK
ncbi:MAG: ubiquinone biosynthesis protein UbiB [Chitinophagales bacterium]|nr:MAG: ubiquinone biosynthesis protein UbiB [Chitinophagales bacterium]